MEPVLPWYFAGPLLGLMIPALIYFNQKQLGVSSSLRVVGSYIFPTLNYFSYDRKQDLWQVWFALGIVLSSLLINHFEGVEVSQSIYNLSNWLWFLIGGVFIGFGARYAGGCTAGHCLMGNATFAISSMITTIGFFTGGMIVSHFIVPLIFKL